MRAEADTVNHGLLKALHYSSGQFRSRTLAKLGHPYREKNIGLMTGYRYTTKGHRVKLKNSKMQAAVPYGDPAMINIQSQTFVKSWVRHMPRIAGNNIVSGFTNTAPYADSLAKGIPGLTMPRPLMDRVIPVVEYWRIKNLARGIRNAIQGKDFIID